MREKKKTHRLDLSRHAQEPTQRDDAGQFPLARDSRQVRNHGSLREPADEDPVRRDAGFEFGRDELLDRPDRGEHARFVVGADAAAGVELLDVEPIS